MRADDGEPAGQATAVVGPARRHRRSREPCLHPRRDGNLDARLRGRTPRVTDEQETPDQQPAPARAEEATGGEPVAPEPLAEAAATDVDADATSVAEAPQAEPLPTPPPVGESS